MRTVKERTIVAAASRLVSRYDMQRKKLRRALKPFAEIALERDTDPKGEDHIAAADLAINPSQVRAARKALQET